MMHQVLCVPRGYRIVFEKITNILKIIERATTKPYIFLFRMYYDASIGIILV